MKPLRDYMLDPPEPKKLPRCPKCGADDYSEIYIGEDGIQGCDECVSVRDAVEYWEEQFDD